MSDQTVETVATVEIFEPPMCCPTGLCGPVQDQTLLDLLETVRSLESKGVKVLRYQPGSNPGVFTNNGQVMADVAPRIDGGVHGLGSPSRKVVRVRIPAAAPTKSRSVQ